MGKEIVFKKNRWFIWAIVIIVIVGVSLIANIYITGIIIEAETSDISISVHAIRKGSINIKSTPWGAAIFLDDEDTGRITNDTIRMKEGKYTVRLKLEGYKDYIEGIEVIRTKTVPISADLEKGEGETIGTSKNEIVD